MITQPIEIYTDGSSLKNPGVSGLAFVIRYCTQEDDNSMPRENTLEMSQGYRLSTNNRMEVLAAIRGLETILEKVKSGEFAGLTQVNLFSDSSYLCDSINQRWIQKWQQNNWMTSGYKGPAAPVKNKDLWMQLIDVQEKLTKSMVNMTITHVKGHADNEWNNRADKLAVAASNSSNHLVDEVFEKLAEQKRQQYQGFQNNYQNYQR